MVFYSLAEAHSAFIPIETSKGGGSMSFFCRVVPPAGPMYVRQDVKPPGKKNNTRTLKSRVLEIDHASINYQEADLISHAKISRVYQHQHQQRGRGSSLWQCRRAVLAKAKSAIPIHSQIRGSRKKKPWSGQVRAIVDNVSSGCPLPPVVNKASPPATRE